MAPKVACDGPERDHAAGRRQKSATSGRFRRRAAVVLPGLTKPASSSTVKEVPQFVAFSTERVECLRIAYWTKAPASGKSSRLYMRRVPCRLRMFASG